MSLWGSWWWWGFWLPYWIEWMLLLVERIKADTAKTFQEAYLNFVGSQIHSLPCSLYERRSHQAVEELLPWKSSVKWQHPVHSLHFSLPSFITTTTFTRPFYSDIADRPMPGTFSFLRQLKPDSPTQLVSQWVLCHFTEAMPETLKPKWFLPFYKKGATAGWREQRQVDLCEFMPAMSM